MLTEIWYWITHPLEFLFLVTFLFIVLKIICMMVGWRLTLAGILKQFK